MYFSSSCKQPKKQRGSSLYEHLCLGKSAETCNKYLQKGSSVLVEGRIRQAKMDNGSYWTEVVADTVQFLVEDKKVEEANVIASEDVEEDLAF